MSRARRERRIRQGGVRACLVGVSAFLLVAQSCAGPLPSTAPLGLGPLAKAEAAEREKREAEREAALASGGSGSDASTPKPPGASGKSASGTGSSDAGAATDAGAKTAAAEAGADTPDKAPAGKVVFAGVYVGEDTSLFKLSGLPDRSEADSNAKTRVEDRADGNVNIIPVDSSNGKDICSLEAVVKDKAKKLFEIKRGQRCFEPEQGGMSGTIRKGSAKFDGDKLTFDVVLALEINTAGTQLTGSLDYHFEGTRP